MSELKLWADYNTQEEYDESTAEYNLREDVQVCKEEIAALRAENKKIYEYKQASEAMSRIVAYKYKEIAAENEAIKNRVCEWTYLRFASGRYQMIISCLGRSSEATKGLKYNFCPYCGGKIKES